MDQWSLFWVAIGVGGVLLVVAAWTDARERRRSRAALSAPPDRQIPDFAGVGPTYVPADDVLARPIQLIEPSDALARELAAERPGAVQLKAGWASDQFATHSNPNRAILGPALVLAAEGVGPMRELLAFLQRARQLGLGVVIAAPTILPETVQTLAANRRQLEAPIVVIQPGAEAMESLVGALKIEAPTRADLQAGWLPANAVGYVDRWVSDAHDSWFIPTAATQPSSGNPQPSSEG